MKVANINKTAQELKKIKKLLYLKIAPLREKSLENIKMTKEFD